ncbi:MAG: hypothetical protein ACRDQ5_13225 [Sciscionella sp.]
MMSETTEQLRAHHTGLSTQAFPAPGSWVRRRGIDGAPDPQGMLGQVQPYEREHAQTFPVKFADDIWRQQLPSEVEVLPASPPAPVLARDSAA